MQLSDRSMYLPTVGFFGAIHQLAMLGLRVPGMAQSWQSSFWKEFHIMENELIETTCLWDAYHIIQDLEKLYVSI